MIYFKKKNHNLCQIHLLLYEELNANIIKLKNMYYCFQLIVEVTKKKKKKLLHKNLSIIIF